MLPSTFPPFVGSKISQLPKRQAVPRVAIVTPTPPKSEEEEDEEEDVTAPTSNSPSKALGPVYVPDVESEKYEVIMATPLEDVDPTMLGLPSGVVIKPASQVIVNPSYVGLPSYHLKEIKFRYFQGGLGSRPCHTANPQLSHGCVSVQTSTLAPPIRETT